MLIGTTLSNSRKILVTDFDGTMTGVDFFRVALTALPITFADHWRRYETGELTHLEALCHIFAGLSLDEVQMTALLRMVELEPDLVGTVAGLRAAGWDLVVASAGCEWYIQELLVDLQPLPEILANPGRFVAGEGLKMSPPRSSPYFDESTGIAKDMIVRAYLASGSTVAFAGDGRPDLAPILLVSPHLRFARGWLAEELTRRGETFTPFSKWWEISALLMSSDGV